MLSAHTYTLPFLFSASTQMVSSTHISHLSPLLYLPQWWEEVWALVFNWRPHGYKWSWRNGKEWSCGWNFNVNVEVGDMCPHTYQSWPSSGCASCQKVLFGGQQHLTREETEIEVMSRLGFPAKFCLIPSYPLLAPVFWRIPFMSWSVQPAMTKYHNMGKL